VSGAVCQKSKYVGLPWDRPSRRAFANPIGSDWYSQCVPGTGGSNPAPTTSQNPSNPAPTSGNGNGNGNGGGNAAAGSLHEKFKAKGKQYFGTEIDHYHLNNAQLMNIAKNEFGQVTHENSMKWDAIEREFPPSPRSGLVVPPVPR
jgi:hypothetical protein